MGPLSLEPSDTQVNLYLEHFCEVKGSAALRRLPACSISQVTTLPLTEEGHAAVWACTAALGALARLSAFLGSNSVSPTALMWGLNETKAGGALTTAFRKS